MKRAYKGFGLALGCGLLPFGNLFLGFLHHIPSAYILREQIVTCTSFSIAIFALTAVGVALLWAVRDARLRWAEAAVFFAVAAIVSLFVPGLLMTASRGFCRFIFSGDSGFAILLAPFGMALFAVPAVIVFAISLVFAHRHSKRTPSQPSESIFGRSQAHYDLGVSLASRNEVTAALYQFGKALEIKPDYAEAHCQVGLLLAKQGKLAEAIKSYRKALEIKPNFAEARQHLDAAIEMDEGKKAHP